jgi:N-acetyl-alpha-D-muramate 1-phosphate uridylyltransferase
VSQQALPVAILAGGLATRLRPLTGTIPKALLDVNGEPFIAHQLRVLRRSGIERVVLCLGYLGELVQEVVGDGHRFDLQVDVSFDGSNLRGTAGALRNAAPLLGQAFYVLYGDSFLQCDYAAIQHAFESDPRLGLMTVYRNDGRFDRSNVELVDGQMVAYDKRAQTQRMRHIDYGLGVLDVRALELVPEEGAYDLATLYADLLGHHELAAYEVRQRFYEIGSLEGLETLRQFLAGQRVPG